MKKPVFLSFFLLLFSFASAQTDLALLRKEYRTAGKDSLSCAKLYKKAIGLAGSEKMLNAYKGAVSMMYAGFVKDKAEKLKLFKTGKEVLEKEIQKDKENPELLLLRFTIQSNAPKVLGYNKDIEHDKRSLLEAYASISNKEVKSSIRSFMLESKLLSTAEKEKLK